jgi:hypothetical protein
VTGLVALLIDQVGANNPAGMRHALRGNATDDLGPRSRDPQFGYGKINAAKALGVL